MRNLNGLLKIMALLAAGTADSLPAQTTVTVAGSELQNGSTFDAGTITLTVNGYAKSVTYGQYSTAASLASAFGALLSSDCSAPVTAFAKGNLITLTPRSSGSAITSVAGSTQGVQNSFSILTSSSSPSSQVPTITWPIPTAIPYGTALSSIQLNATASVPGTFTYNQTAGTVLGAGIDTLSLTFTPNDTQTYASTTATVQLQVTAVPTSITLTTSASTVSHGTTLSLTATITNGATGNIAFHDGALFLGNGTISGNTAVLTTNTLPSGTHALTASWQGNGNYAASTSSNIVQVVTGVPLSGQPGIITTVAGNGVQGYTGDGGLATAAALLGPTGGIGVDANDNIYFCDGTARVREVSSTTGIITTVAGSGSAGYSGDGGPAVSASIHCQALAVDAAGDIFIGDVTTNRIRKVSASDGTITTVAGNGSAGYSGDGGPATSASINLSSAPSGSYAGTTPVEIRVDPAGNVYFYNSFTDKSNNPTNYLIRVVQASSGVVSTYPNVNTQTSLASGYTFFGVDSSGNVYIIPTNANGAIYKLGSASGNPITVVAGTAGNAGYSGDGGPALNAQIYPTGGIVDAAGNIYIEQGNVIRKINATTGIISVVASRGGPGEGCLGQTDVIGDGCLYIDAPPNGSSGGIAVLDSNGTMYSADPLYIRAITAPVPTQIQPSSTTLACDTGRITYGESITCSASVISGATGTISIAYPFSATQTLYAPAIPVATGGTSIAIPLATLPVGTYAIAATYNGDSTYVPSLVTTPIVITRATPTIVWPTSTSTVYGTPLSAQQLNASSSVPGTFTYSPGLGAMLPVGNNTITVKFQPNDTVNYAGPITVSQTLVVSKATPSLSWAIPASIEYGTPISSLQLNATANVPGNFAYSYSGSTISAASGTVLPVGSDTLMVTFTPTSSTNDTSTAPISASVQINVIPDTPTIAGIISNPAVVGASVTLNGQNFGPSQGSSSVTFNGVAAAVTSWTDTAVVATVPANASTGNVIVNVNGISSNNFLFMVLKTCP